MTDPRTVRKRRIVNAVVWLVLWGGIVAFTKSWGDWGSMFFESLIPIMLGGYIHLILRGQSTPQ